MENISGGQAVARARVVDVKPLRYVARQPIFDRAEKVFGYELLFRDGLENAFHGDTDEASRATLDRTLLMGLDVLCDGRCAFVNCTRDTLIKGLVTLLPSTTTVVEVLDIIKVEMQLTTEEQQSALIKRFGPWRCRMLAEKIETRAEFVRDAGSGVRIFPGVFFRRPEMMNTRDMPANRTNYLRIAAGGIASGPGIARTGEADQGGDLGLLPAIAILEFDDVWVSERDPFGATCPVDAGWAGGRRRPAISCYQCWCGGGLANFWRRACSTGSRTYFCWDCCR
ncbi:MAG: hypothetical protein WA741_11165 [Candidatus Sulfotelmatobacter sp.]